MSAYTDWIRTLECTVCGSRRGVQAAHMRGLDKLSGGAGLKPDDLYVIPLCGCCHAIEHNEGRGKLFDARQENMLLVLCGMLKTAYSANRALREFGITSFEFDAKTAVVEWRNRYMRGR